MKVPKILFVALLFVLSMIMNANNPLLHIVQATVLKPPIQMEDHHDWSALFPEIPNCEREIYPINISSDGNFVEQTANYKKNGIVCGSITLRLKSSLKKDRQEIIKMHFRPTTQKVQIKNFEAYRYSPQCGNDDWLGSIEVFFDEDKSFTVSANRGDQDILKLAETIDYERLKRTMSKATQQGRKSISNE